METDGSGPSGVQQRRVARLRVEAARDPCDRPRRCEARAARLLGASLQRGEVETEPLQRPRSSTVSGEENGGGSEGEGEQHSVAVFIARHALGLAARIPADGGDSREACRGRVAQIPRTARALGVVRTRLRP